jgi:hypothetical protein
MTVAIFDEIQDRLRKQGQGLQGAAPAVGTQDALTKAAQAGSGRDLGTGAPVASNVGEQTQAAAGAAQSSQLASRLGAAADRLSQQQETTRAAAASGADKLAASAAGFGATQAAAANARATTRQAATDSLGASLAGQESRGLAAATQAYTNKSKDLASEGASAAADVFAGFKQGNQDLAFRKDQAKLEATAQRLALGDREYVDSLNQVGTLRRLDDEGNWRAEMQRLTLGDKLTAALGKAKFQVDLNSDQRAFNEQMASMDVDTATAVLISQLNSANTAQVFKGIGDIASTGGKAYVASQKEAPADTAPAPAPTATGASAPGGSP